MSVVATAPVAIQTCPQDVPSLPAWFAEVTLLAHHLRRQGILDALCDQVHLARGRMGQYEVIDFLGRALWLCYQRRADPRGVFSSVWPPLPVPSWRSLAGSGCLTAARSLASSPLSMSRVCKRCEPSLSRTASRMNSRQEHVRWLVGSQGAAAGDHRCRCHATSGPPARPGHQPRVPHPQAAAARRSVPRAHRAQAWRSRAHPHHHLAGPHPAVAGHLPGSGQWRLRGRAEAACQVVTQYLQQRSAARKGCCGLDGLYGNASVLIRIQQAGLGFLTRAKEYQLLTHPRSRPGWRARATSN